MITIRRERSITEDEAKQLGIWPQIMRNRLSFSGMSGSDVASFLNLDGTGFYIIFYQSGFAAAGRGLVGFENDDDMHLFTLKFHGATGN